MHPVQRPQHSRLTAAGRADEGCHIARLYRDRHTGNGLKRTVVDVHVFEIDALSHWCLFSGRSGSVSGQIPVQERRSQIQSAHDQDEREGGTPHPRTARRLSLIHI